jgi:nucleoside-diphosphate-sugar epimerase
LGCDESNHPLIFENFWGTYIETYNEQLYIEAGITAKFAQDDSSVSSKQVLRGIHGDRQRIMNAARARAIKFKPQIPLAEGVQEVMEWYSKNRHTTSKRYDVFV